VKCHHHHHHSSSSSSSSTIRLPETELYEEKVKARIPPGKRLYSITKATYANRYKLLGTAGRRRGGGGSGGG